MRPSGAPRETSAYRFDLPADLIAKTPAEPRDASRLLVLARDGPPVDAHFSDFPSRLWAGDVLVLNETRVIRARLIGKRKGGAPAEILLLRPARLPRYSTEARDWLALVRPGRKLPPGSWVDFGPGARAEVGATGEGGVREVTLALEMPLEAFLDTHGGVPLPPYVGPGDSVRDAAYQTVFARVPGSVAAPTASLHFTDAVLASVRARGVQTETLTLDVGLGTFRPIDAPSIDGHVMHAEHFDLPEATVRAVLRAKREGRRVVAAGTTVARALEGAAAARRFTAGEGETAVYITPGFRFRVVDALLTNFHLPASSLLTMVCAFGGYERVMEAYGHAVEAGYRFFSFGDAMFVERAEAPKLRREDGPGLPA